MVRYTDAINKAEPIGNKDLSWNRSVPGFMIIRTPTKPIIIASILCIPIFSPRIGTANRAAIIGGDVITNPESYYNNYYFFTDYVTLELFAYNLEENKLYLFPVNNIYNTNPTSLRVHPSKKDTLMVGLKSGQILNIKLPEIPRLELDN